MSIALSAAYDLARWSSLDVIRDFDEKVSFSFSLNIINSTKTWKILKPLKIVFRGLASVVDI